MQLIEIQNNVRQVIFIFMSDKIYIVMKFSQSSEAMNLSCCSTWLIKTFNKCQLNLFKKFGLSIINKTLHVMIV